jgi:phenylpyruvate tautomerase PptA (4-oxalocrotonate tautomerase family)
MQLSDLMAAVLRLPDRSILVVLVYVEPQDAEGLRVAIYELR